MNNIFFVCSANKDRSRTAEDHFSSVCSQYEFDSGGTNQKICRQLGTTYIYKEQFKNADKVFVMESKHKKAIEQLFGNIYTKKIMVLNIKDVYRYGDRNLIEVLENKLKMYL